MQNCFINTVST